MNLSFWHPLPLDGLVLHFTNTNAHHPPHHYRLAKPIHPTQRLLHTDQPSRPPPNRKIKQRVKLTENSALISECNSLRKENNSLKRTNEILRLEAKEMAARPSQAQPRQTNARPGNAPEHGGKAHGRGGSRGRGGSDAAAGSADEGISQQSRSVGDLTSITIMEAVRFATDHPAPTPPPSLR